jgi:hypothetical protein
LVVTASLMAKFGTLILVEAGAAAFIYLSIDIAARKRLDTHVAPFNRFDTAGGLVHQC